MVVAKVRPLIVGLHQLVVTIKIAVGFLGSANQRDPVIDLLFEPRGTFDAERKAGGLQNLVNVGVIEDVPHVFACLAIRGSFKILPILLCIKLDKLLLHRVGQQCLLSRCPKSVVYSDIHP